MKLLIPSASGLEAVVKRQLDRLGYPDTKANNGRIVVNDCTWQDVATLNLWLRSGERVLISVASFACESFDQLYEGIRGIFWKSYLVRDSRVTVITKTVKSKLFAHNAIQSIGKKAIVDAMTQAFGVTPTETGAETVVEIALYEDVATINLDTTGVGLHKRGYRTLSYSAPLKETTASAMLDLSVWHGDKVFSDVFCGSGTLPIEAALKALNVAPGLNRDFAYQKWAVVPEGTHEETVALARDMKKDRPLQIFASDVSEKAISIAKYHAQKAGVAKYINFAVADAKDFYNGASYGVNISNPPYGERLGDEQQVVEIAKFMGKAYKRLDNWNFYFLTPFQGFERCFGKKADKKRKIYNAGIECSFYSFNGAKPPKDN
ncbi:MAG: class I SAM-dependent RNA methyltransferase [Clostridia bacterium]|nr:class I SAM-dependent RNA methyltransferase [Clostridia bacterium]